MIRTLAWIVLAAGIALLSLNLAGIASGLRSPELAGDSIAQWWGDAKAIDTYAMRVPLRENFVLWSLSWAAPRVYREYEFCNARKAVERGLGLCSQASIVLVTTLRENGVDASSAPPTRSSGHCRRCS